MTEGRLSPPRLQRMHDVMAGYVDRGEIPGLVTMLSRRGDVQVEVFGTKGLGGNEPVRRDTIFRIASMTKPIAAVAAMMLVEDCRLRLDDPVDRYLPELADRQVLKAIDGPLDETVPANRPISVRDLLTLRMGLGIILTQSEDFPIQQAIRDLDIVGFGPPDPGARHSPDEWLRRLGSLPLMHQPGEQWMYNTGSSVLGVLIARAAGMPLEVFLREKIFDPLGMRDTSFSVPPEKLDRLASTYQMTDGGDGSGALELLDGVVDSAWRHDPAFPDAAGGLVSTVDDCLAFGQMLMNGGRYGNVRILSRPSVEVMTRDHLLPGQRDASTMILGANRGWGFGMSVVTQRDDVSAVPGRFGWDGGFGTSWASDPSEGMVGILMTQVMGFPSGIYSDFWTTAYTAIDD